jgi:phosphoserine phosphatase
LLDVTKEEEDAPDAVDIPIAIIPSSEEIVLLQMDGLLTKAEWEKALPMAIEGCKKVSKIQEEALKIRYDTKEFHESLSAEVARVEAPKPAPFAARFTSMSAAPPAPTATADALEEEAEDLLEEMQEVEQ